MLFTITPGSSVYQKEILDDYFKSRKRIFMERLKWGLFDCDGREIDHFDHSQSNYLISVENGEVIGGVRLTPTRKPNLTFNLFKRKFNLFKGIKRSDKMLECSRFGLEKPSKTKSVKLIQTKTLELFEGMMKFALDNGFDQIIAVTDLRIERILQISKWPMQRLAHPKMIDGSFAVIGILEVNWETYTRFREQRVKMYNATALDIKSSGNISPISTKVA